jgi:hypothetical protein
MKKTKFVTSYYMDVTEFTKNKWIGSSASRKQRYLSSIIYHCKNFPNYNIVCYTHNINLIELEKIKTDYSLNNLTIKVKEMDEIKYTNGINSVVNLVPDYMERFGLPGRPPQVMWGKFDIVREECDEDVEYLYWIDAGLQAVQLMPLRYNPHINEPDIWTSFEKQGNFGLLFNESLINKLNLILQDKFFNIMCTTLQSYVHSFDDYYPIHDSYPIGGFFGGHKNSVLEYCNIFDESANKHLKNNILCFEDAIMKQATDRYPKEKLFTLKCDVHATPLTEKEFHYDIWDELKNLPKPIWRIWEEIRDNY